MSCNYFKKYTRTCHQDSDLFMDFSTAEICESDKYELCPAYRLLQDKPHCKYLYECTDFFLRHGKELKEKIGNQYFEKLNDLDKFCYNLENCKNCYFHKMKQQNKQIEPFVLMDGTKIE